MIVATAGHVDHGKTSLVKALTGVDTDRLPEEKRRGMTIDLGFAYAPSLGFVDVPGHERFVRNMLAGVAGVDFALLVVAADDGVMPQTREHLAILDLLGIARGAVALTKIDRAAPERVAEVEREIRGVLADTRLAEAPILPVSVVSGQGVDALKAQLERAAAAQAPREADGNFRLPIDRSFKLAGAGLVVTGTAMSGQVAVGDPVRLLLAGVTARVRSIHAQNSAAPLGRAGERCALNLSGLDGKAPIERGDWVVAGDAPPAVRRFDARVRVLPGEARALAHWAPVHVHIGAADVLGRVAMLEGRDIPPGDSRLAQLVLEQPVGAAFGDAFILRDPSARRTLGGGTVVDAFPPTRGRARTARLRELAAIGLADPAAALAKLMADSPAGTDLARFAVNRNLVPAAAEALFARVPMKRAGAWAYSPQRWSALRESILESAAAGRAPLLARGAAPEEAVAALVTELVQEGLLVRDGAALRPAGKRADLAPADAALWEKCRPLLERSALRPPSVAELALQAEEDPRRLEAALARLEKHGLTVRLSKGRFILPHAVRRLQALAEEEAQASGRITAAAFRDRTGIGRNAAIEVLEFFDRIKFTRRVGDSHALLKPAQGRDSHPGGAPGLQIQ